MSLQDSTAPLCYVPSYSPESASSSDWRWEPRSGRHWESWWAPREKKEGIHGTKGARYTQSACRPFRPSSIAAAYTFYTPVTYSRLRRRCSVRSEVRVVDKLAILGAEMKEMASGNGKGNRM